MVAVALPHEPLLGDYAERGFVRIPSHLDNRCFDLPGTRFQQWGQAVAPWFQGLFDNYWADDSLAGSIDANGEVCLSAEPSCGIALEQPFFVFSGCVLRNCGGAAVHLRGSASGLLRCEISNPGEDGVVLEGGSRPTLTPSQDFVLHSEIHHFGRWARTYHPAVKLAGCGHVIKHNFFHDAPHAAILFTGNEHEIASNRIEQVVLEANDAGAIYTGRDWGYRGNLIRYNFIHRIDSIFGGAHGVYLDDAASGITVFGNLMVDVNGRATLSGGGRDNLFENNVMVGCFDGGHAADRRAQAVANNSYSGGRPNSWNLLGRLNVVYESYQSMSPIAYQSAPWSTAYPSLAAIPFAEIGILPSPMIFADGFEVGTSDAW